MRCELTVGPKRRPPLHLPRPRRRPAGDRLLARRPGHPVRRDRPAAGAPRVARARASPRARSSSRARRWRCTWSRRRRLAAAALVRPPADARRHPARLRPDPADHAAPVRADVGGRSRAGQVVELRFGFSLRGVRPGPDEPARATAAPRRRCAAFEPGAAATDGGRWREHLASRVETPSAERATSSHRALPLADQALLRPGREPVLADQRAVRLRHLHHVGHLPHPAAADHRAVPARAVELAERPAERSARRRATCRSATGWPRAPTASPARAARWRRRSSPTCASSGCPASTGTGRCATWTPTCAARTARSTCCAGSRTRSPTPSTWRSATTARPRSPAHVGDHSPGHQFEGAGHPLGQRLRPDDRAAASTPRSTRAASGTTRSGCCTTCGARIELAGGDDAFLALLDRFFGYGADPVKQVGERPSVAELAAGYALNRFEGLNNEPDMEAPVGLPLRRAARTGPPRSCTRAVDNMFGLGRGGPAGQRRLRRAELLVRLGLARAVPGRRARASTWSTRRRSPGPGCELGGERARSIEHHRVRRAGPGDGRCSTSSPSTFNDEPLGRQLAQRRATCTAAAADRPRPDPSAWGTTTRPPSVTPPGRPTEQTHASVLPATAG